MKKKKLKIENLFVLSVYIFVQYERAFTKVLYLY